MKIASKYRKDEVSITAPSSLLGDSELSWKAKGLMLYLLAYGDGGKVRVADLMPLSKDGKTAVRAALSELQTKGYLE